MKPKNFQIFGPWSRNLLKGQYTSQWRRRALPQVPPHPLQGRRTPLCVCRGTALGFFSALHFSSCCESMRMSSTRASLFSWQVFHSLMSSECAFLHASVHSGVSSILTPLTSSGFTEGVGGIGISRPYTFHPTGNATGTSLLLFSRMGTSLLLELSSDDGRE
jgi:hypothetical protein